MKPPAAVEVCDTDPAAISAARAHELIAQTVAPLVQSETVALRDALGRVAAVDVKAAAAVPNHTNSAMDGYALRGADLPDAASKDTKALRVVGVSMAGKPFDGTLRAGECARIMTGAVMPAGADSVVAQERVERDGDLIQVRGGETPGANVRHAGEDLEIGDVAIAAGRRLAPSHLGLAASLGCARLSVVRRPRVAFFSNGDELRPVGTRLKIGELHDSNRYTLHGLLTQLDVDMIDLGVVPDDAHALGAMLTRAAESADMVITSAGASVGDADYIGQTVTRLGSVVFSKVAIKPGRPLVFGRLRKTGGESLFFGLPGNPVSVMVTFEIFVDTALRQLAGETESAPLRLMAKTTAALKKRRGRVEYQRGVLTLAPDGSMQVGSTGGQGSGILRSMGDANCFIILPTDSSGAQIGAMVEVRPFARGG